MPSPTGSRLLLLAQIAGVAGLAAHYLGGAIDVWSADPPGSAANYTALLGTAAMAWVRWGRLRDAAPGRSAAAAAAFVAATLVYAAADQLDLLALVGVAFWALTASLLYQQHGRRGLVAMRMPLLLLLLSVPIPARILAPLVTDFLDATRACLIAMLQLSGLAPQVSGYTLTMAGGTVTLVHDCSGLNGMTLFLPLTLLLLESCRPLGRARYLAVCALAAPLAFAANLLRVFTESVLVANGLRGEHADTLHEVFGIVALVGSAAAIWLLARFAHRAWQRKQSTPEVVA